MPMATAGTDAICKKRHTDNLDAYFETDVEHIITCAKHTEVTDLNFVSTTLDESSPVAILYYNNNERNSNGFAAVFHLLSKTVKTLRYATFRVSGGTITPPEAAFMTTRYSFSSIPSIVVYRASADGVDVSQIRGHVKNSRDINGLYLESLDYIVNVVLRPQSTSPK
ncbi:MAG: hypothetical protein RDU24_11550 [Humidesulfovibrio sp.]|nr:hypothetical protein [Humidesulfovibrio sp.]